MRKHALGMVAIALLLSGCNNDNYLPPTSQTAAGAGGGSLTALVARAASDNHVPAALVYAVMQAESGGDPNALSPHGAAGLMQLMPATAAQCGLSTPFDPQGNLECGAAYLSRLMTRFGGDVTLTIAAYNAGPNAVARVHGVPPSSASYVQRVLNLYQTASAATGEAAPRQLPVAAPPRSPAAAPQGPAARSAAATHRGANDPTSAHRD
jgi:soluble lytic murein transglycosylase-like protein